ncbi:MAG TPA: (2Fe-2S)-binding protein [Kiloniellales bacterium]|nr:(2Fe-2S)-binding protein [Kiloniellales bacterium]
MYVCLCNGFTCRDVRKAIQGGATSVGGVFRACDARPNCGKCKDVILDYLAEAEAPARGTSLALPPAFVAAE